MSKRTTMTSISALPPGITREVVIDFLHNFSQMIDLNPLVIERHIIPTPAHAPADERDCVWYSITDKIAYLPGGLANGEVTYTCVFKALPNGLQTHCYAPAGLGRTLLRSPSLSSLYPTLPMLSCLSVPCPFSSSPVFLALFHYYASCKIPYFAIVLVLSNLDCQTSVKSGLSTVPCLASHRSRSSSASGPRPRDSTSVKISTCVATC